ncbi:MAG: GFA family protein [Candidatus Hydrogenedentota bacterium]
MTEPGMYSGSCHCGKIRFEVKLALEKAIACNCSICSKAGWLLAFVPADQFTLLSGEDALADYQFGKKRIHHYFCPSCGIHPFGAGTGPNGQEMRAVNVRCLEGVDPESLVLTKFDGKKL